MTEFHSAFRPQDVARDLPQRRALAARRQLELVAAGSRTRRGHRVAVMTGAGAIVLLGTGAAAYVAATQPVTNKSQARCYTVASLAGGSDFPGTTIGQPSSLGSRTAQVDNALSVCAALWRQGILRPGASGPAGPTSSGPARTYPVPPLVSCVLPDGTAAVLPGDPGTCARLGLPSAAATP